MVGGWAGATVQIAVEDQGHRLPATETPAGFRKAKAQPEVLQRVILAASGTLTRVGSRSFVGPLELVGDPPRAIVQLQ